MKTLTIFTPTYNRAYCLIHLYESLLRQTSNDFEWLIIDDGSTDNTKELTNLWISENKIKISYFYKANGGMHTGHNAALNIIDTELCICIDSDDYMPDDAVNNILKLWDANRDKGYAGILGLDSYKDGSLVSSKKFPEQIKSGKYSFLKSDYGISGDVKFVYQTSIIKKYPDYPVFEGEKFVPLGYKYRLIDRDYEMLFLNSVLCVVEYMEDGSTKNMYRQYFRNPKGFAHSRLTTMKYTYPFKDRFFQAVHFVAETLLSKGSMFKNNPKWLMTIFSLPLGFALYIYILYLNKK
ncbi:glycosyltransferase family 2 protein [Flavobacterium sp. SUN046]|uniref:glycosyltransferase family 2 protein n=1 Tax=Flavobacterium sp. SUN046 TaxID=3002440 RepID=UPI002DBE4BB7|nr:glycosyltransferase family 2 protein [Flavobacterium sp. SUN046]MEC4050886.1 glycosyltransferase family 2 protein [Flavobacterium sp. SUN046]